MPLSSHLKAYLEKNGIEYDIVTHEATQSAGASAQSAHIPGDNMLKSVVIHCDEGYMLAVVPSTHRVELGTLQDIVEKRLGLATEREIGELFGDCELGAIPAVGEPFGLTVIMDDALDEAKDVWFEGGDHESLIHLEKEAFQKLMRDAEHGHFSHHV